MIQGAAAELFKMWAVTVRARTAARDARIVLCLHDELLVHVPEPEAKEMAELVSDCLQETARRWAPGTGATGGLARSAAAPGRVRFLADIATVRCWADAKPARTSPAPVDGGGGGQPISRDADGHGGHGS
jgi:DNA polymerase-1